MAKQKICPVCGAVNNEAEALCAGCGSDILGAKIVECVESLDNQDAPFKKCPACGTVNRDYDMLCADCGEDISGAPVKTGSPRRPAAQNAPESGTYIEKTGTASKKLYLVSREEKIIIEIKDGGIFGRCDECRSEAERERSGCRGLEGPFKRVDCVKYNTVSRRHAQFRFENDEFYITPLIESKNTTSINGEELVRGRSYKLSDRDCLQFSSKLKLIVVIK